MIVRDARRAVTDYGPTPATTRHYVPGGALARPAPAAPSKPRPKPLPNYLRDWKRMKRATDPEWLERERARDREYRRRKAAA